ARDHVVGAADVARRLNARLRMCECARRGRLEGVEALAEQGADHAAQHVARAGGGERRRRAGTDRRRAVARLRHDRVVALQQDDRLAALGRLFGMVEAAALDLLRVDLEQPAQFTRVRGEHGGRVAFGDVLDDAGECVQAVGAPVRPGDPPAMTTTPDWNFDPSRGRCGTSASTRFVMRPAFTGSGAPRGTPMSTMRTVPEWNVPGATWRPIFEPWKVPVASA